MQQFLRGGLGSGELSAVSAAINTRGEGCRFAALSPQPVEDFPAPRIDPLCYPGRRPPHAFTTSEGYIWPLKSVEDLEGARFGLATYEGVFDLDDALRSYGVLPMAERIPVVGFGSNACPGQLAEKFSPAQDKKGDITDAGDHHIVPTLRGKLRDVAAAYSSKLGIRGYVFAELIAAERAETEVCVNFLSPRQLARMKRSEGAYEFCNLGEVCIEGLTRSIPAYGFAGKNEVLLDRTGQPILLADVPVKGTDLQSMSEVQVLDMLARDFGPQLDEIYPHAPFFADSAANLAAYIWYRTEFLRRDNPAPGKGTIKYKHHPAPGEAPDELVGVSLQNILRAAGRVAQSKFLDTLSDDHINVTPHTFEALYRDRVKV